MINQIDVAAGTWRAFAQDFGCELQCAKSQQVFSNCLCQPHGALILEAGSVPEAAESWAIFFALIYRNGSLDAESCPTFGQVGSPITALKHSEKSQR